MNKLQRGVAIVPVLIILGFLGIVSAGAYYYFRAPQDSLAVQQLKLAQAKAKLQGKKVKLVTVEEEFAKTYSIYSILRAQYTKTEVIVEVVDNYLADPKVDKALTEANAKVKKDIDTKYDKIKTLMDSWKAKVDYTYAPNVTVGTLNTFKKDAETIKTLIQTLQNTVENLTPDDSALTQAQIDAYEEQLQDALTAINSTITAVTNAVTQSTQNPPFPPTNPVTPQQIEQAQEEVTQAQAEVDAAQAEVDAATPTPPGTPPPPPGTPSPTPTTPSPTPTPTPNPVPPPLPPPTNLGPDNSNGEDMYPYNSIIITPPTPPLIQGSNNN